MKKLNVIIVLDKEGKKVLMCKREKEPYKGLFNLVGGKLEKGEENLFAAYRELEEETGITNKDIILSHFMNFEYYLSNIELQVYVGKLKHRVDLIEEVNRLYWIDKSEDFFDVNKFAGEGNIGHMMMLIEIYKDKLFLKM